MIKLRPIEWCVIITFFVVVVMFLAPSFGSAHYFSPDTLESKYKTEILILGTDTAIYQSSDKPKEENLSITSLTKDFGSDNTWPRHAGFARRGLTIGGEMANLPSIVKSIGMMLTGLHGRKSIHNWQR